ncbi:MAG: hydrogenase maturation nickel metallochaperone HypA [Planctomycetales bacterium]|nr:hydrogenase maturation nickel metallochaperone HypA [Planctomycetales bacterium]
MIRALLELVEQVRAEHQAAEATGDSVEVFQVHVEVGPLTGAEPDLLQSAFRSLTQETSMDQATLRISAVPLTASCLECGENFEIVEFRFFCPHCQGHVRVTGGDSFQLVSIDVRPSAPQSRPSKLPSSDRES